MDAFEFRRGSRTKKPGNHVGTCRGPVPAAQQRGTVPGQSAATARWRRSTPPRTQFTWHRWRTPIWRVAGLLLATLLPAPAAQYYVTPGGSSAGDGSAAKPWDLQTALAQPNPVKPGDTLWIRGGVHRVNNFPTQFRSVLAGTAARPITVRAWPGERVTIDGNLTQYQGGWVNYWGLEISDSLPNRTSPQTGPFPTTWWETLSTGRVVDYCVSGVDLRVPNVTLINCIIHDAIGGGFGVNSLAAGSEVYGSLAYYNGWQGADRGHGHGLYLQNAGPATTRITDSLFFANYALGAQATGNGPGPVANDIDFAGNAFFMNGSLATKPQFNFLVGPFAGVSRNIRVVSNCVYDTTINGTDANIGYIGGTTNAVVNDNYFGTTVWLGSHSGLTLSGNTFWAGTILVDQAAYPNNTYRTTLPTTGTKILVRPNRYETGRANIIIYNWDQAPTVTVDIASIGLAPGDQFELHNVQDFYTDIRTGTYSNGVIAIPMTDHTVAAPTSHAAPPSTFPKFGAFVILPQIPDWPTISGLATQTTTVNTATGPLPFTVGSLQVPASNLTVTATSSNPTLVPVANIVCGGTATNRTVTISPAVNQIGSAAITLIVSDGTNSARTSFTLTVNAAPPSPLPPTITPAGGTFTNAVKVTLRCPTVGVTIRYTTTGADPTIGSVTYQQTAIILTNSATLKAQAFRPRLANSAVATAAFTVIPPAPLAITTTSLAAGKIKVNYAALLAATGGLAPYRWSLATGRQLPAGLALNGTTGLVAGKPLKAGTYSITVKVTDARPQTTTQTLPLIIGS